MRADYKMEDYDRVVDKLSASQAREAELREKLEAAEDIESDLKDALACVSRTRDAMHKELAKWQQRAEAAEARIKASQEQEPVGYLNTAVWKHSGYTSVFVTPERAFDNQDALYTQPPIPPELAELQRENEQLKAWHEYEKGKRQALQAENAELRKLLEESKVPEEVLIEIVTQSHMAGQFNQSQRDPSYYEARVYYGQKQLEIRASLAQPKEPKQ